MPMIEENDTKVVLKHLKENEGLVTTKYAQKMVGLDGEAFKKFTADHGLECVKKHLPHSPYLTHFWPEKRIKQIINGVNIAPVKDLSGKELFKIKREKEWELDLKNYNNLPSDRRIYIQRRLDRKSFRVVMKIQGKLKSKNALRLHDAIQLRDSMLQHKAPTAKSIKKSSEEAAQVANEISKTFNDLRNLAVSLNSLWGKFVKLTT